MYRMIFNDATESHRAFGSVEEAIEHLRLFWRKAEFWQERISYSGRIYIYESKAKADDPDGDFICFLTPNDKPSRQELLYARVSGTEDLAVRPEEAPVEYSSDIEDGGTFGSNTIGNDWAEAQSNPPESD